MNQENKKVILLVDDDENTRKMYAELFRQEEIEVLEAQDGIEGLDVATSRNDIDIIFTGIIMPRMDGFQFMKALKEYAHTSNIPVVINSHLGREEDRKKAMELGAKDFIIRGIVPPKEVVQRVLQVVGAGEYQLYICKDKGEVKKFANDLGLKEDLTCPECQGDLFLKIVQKKNGQLTANVFCSSCGKIY